MTEPRDERAEATTGSTGPVSWSIEDGIAQLWLQRPGVLNAIDLETARLFTEAVDHVVDLGVKLLVIRGTGRAFCAGGDVIAMAASVDPARYVADLVQEFHEGVNRLSAASVVVVAVVHGTAAGAGLGIVLAADVVIAAESSRFLAAYSGVGLTPDAGVSYLLPRVVGARRAAQMCLLGRALGGREAMEWGLVTSVVPDEQLDQHVDEVVRQLAQGPVQALGDTALLLRTGMGSEYRAHLEMEAIRIAMSASQDEAVARIRSFGS
jgi:2-(1,2-epoxy-1,2-dihydrophenyl)acetyl-CoA isomerase